MESEDMPCVHFSFADPHFALAVIWGTDAEYHRARLASGQRPLQRGPEPISVPGCVEGDPELLWVSDREAPKS